MFRLSGSIGPHTIASNRSSITSETGSLFSSAQADQNSNKSSFVSYVGNQDNTSNKEKVRKDANIMFEWHFKYIP